MEPKPKGFTQALNERERQDRLDYWAGLVLESQALLDDSWSVIAERAYDAAEAMEAEREKRLKK
jgi:hypothetical protein